MKRGIRPSEHPGLLRAGTFSAVIASAAISAVLLGASCARADSPAAVRQADAAEEAAAGAIRVEHGAAAASGADTDRITMDTLQGSFRAVAAGALPVVVEVDIADMSRQAEAASPFSDPTPENPLPEGEGFQTPGLGSGVLVRKDGRKAYVITNEHVVAGAEKINVTLYDERRFTARIVGTDPRTDLALLVFETGDSVPLAKLGDSDALYVGDWAIAVGNPLGFESTVTVGIISALGRRPDYQSGISARYTDYIQTDAAINEGNSGGALLNIRGEVIGINSWIASGSGGSIGLGFAVPINIVKDAVDDFIESGRVIYGWLGITPVFPAEAEFPELAEDLDIRGRRGSLVLNVVAGSPAEESGLLPGDFIIKMGDVPVQDEDHLTYVIGRVKPGTRMVFTVIRYGEVLTIPAVLTARETEERVQSSELWPGFTVQKLTADMRDRAQLPSALKGFVVAEVSSRTGAARAGFRLGDVITEINGNAVEDYIGYYRAMNAEGLRRLEFQVWRDGVETTLSLSRPR